jgi:pilus assembly protein CpaC
MKPILAAICIVASAGAVPLRAGAIPENVMSQTVDLEIGKGRLIHLSEPVASVFIADPAVADVQARSPRLIYLFGKAAGETSFFAIDKQDRPVDSFAVRVRYDEAGLRAALAASLPGNRIQIGMAQDALVLSGSLATPAEVEDALEIAQRFVAGHDRSRILNRLSVDTPTQINLRVRIAEVSRAIVRQFGFNWEALGAFGDVQVGLATGHSVVTADGFNTRSSGTDSVVGSLKTSKLDINGVIDALDNKGLVTILAEPNLTALSGVPAYFLAGGEYPIPVPQGNQVVTIEYKKFGVSLAFVATITEGGRVNLSVKPEVSQLTDTGALVIDGMRVPALTTRRVETVVDLASGQSFALAGLLQSNRQNNLRKFPGLGDVPILGELFRSRRFERNETELVVIVTPYLVRPVDSAEVHLPKGENP